LKRGSGSGSGEKSEGEGAKEDKGKGKASEVVEETMKSDGDSDLESGEVSESGEDSDVGSSGTGSNKEK
jgi:hypothetical protein